MLHLELACSASLIKTCSSSAPCMNREGEGKLKGKSCLALFAAIVMLCVWIPEKGEAEPDAVPVRDAVEALGGTVLWVKEEKAAKVLLGNRKWNITPGSARSEIDGLPLDLPKPAVLNRMGRLYVPVSAFHEALGVQMNFRDGRWRASEADPAGLGMYWMRLLQLGEYGEARDMMSKGLAKLFSADVLERYKRHLEESYGSWTLIQAGSTENRVHRNAVLSYQTPRGRSFRMELRFGRDGKLDDLALLPNVSDRYRPPSYDAHGRYITENVIVGTASLPLPGTLTLPAGAGEKVPAVVLVHGSGPNDADESSGGGKMFRDIAVGLAREGIAVLRYAKRTYEYPNRSLTPHFTVREETVEDALSAVGLLRQDKRIDPDRIFVLGHSQGGMLLPAIIEEDRGGSIAGGMLLSAPSGALEDLMLSQYEGILKRAEEAGETGAELERKQANLHTWRRAVDMLHDDRYSKGRLPADFPLPNAYWWFDIREYSGPMIARGQDVPLFILQGGNDVQVPPSSLKVWKQALGTRTDVSCKLYPGLNHMYALYDRPSTGDEYRFASNVPEFVIRDLADWIHLGIK